MGVHTLVEASLDSGMEPHACADSAPKMLLISQNVSVQKKCMHACKKRSSPVWRRHYSQWRWRSWGPTHASAWTGHTGYPSAAHRRRWCLSAGGPSCSTGRWWALRTTQSHPGGKEKKKQFSRPGRYSNRYVNGFVYPSTVWIASSKGCEHIERTKSNGIRKEGGGEMVRSLTVRSLNARAETPTACPVSWVM